MTPIELRTPRLLLRPFQVSDAGDALAYRDDEVFARYLPHVPIPFTRRHAEALVQRNLSEPWDRSPTFAVVLAQTVIGTVNFEVDGETQSAMLGYAFGRTWWGGEIEPWLARRHDEFRVRRLAQDSGAWPTCVRIGTSTNAV